MCALGPILRACQGKRYPRYLMYVGVTLAPRGNRFTISQIGAIVEYALARSCEASVLFAMVTHVSSGKGRLRFETVGHRDDTCAHSKSSPDRYKHSVRGDRCGQPNWSMM